MMKCQHAGCDEQATVHVTQVKGGEVSEVNHLCEQHALEMGLVGAPPSLAALMANMITASGVGEPEGGSEARCEHCDMPWSAFQSGARLGCPHCYQVFHAQIMPLLERMHDGVRHQGRIPRELGAAAGQRRQLYQLQTELREAVAREDYEHAASLRDQIHILEQETAGSE